MAGEPEFNMPIVPDDPTREVVTTQGYLDKLHADLTALRARLAELQGVARENNAEATKAWERVIALEAKLAAAERRAADLRHLLAEAALPLEALSWAAQWEIAPAILTQIDAVLPQIRAALVPPPATATCWWDAGVNNAPASCRLHGASVFLCPRGPEGA